MRSLAYESFRKVQIYGQNTTKQEKRKKKKKKEKKKKEKKKKSGGGGGGGGSGGGGRKREMPFDSKHIKRFKRRLFMTTKHFVVINSLLLTPLKCSDLVLER